MNKIQTVVVLMLVFLSYGSYGLVTEPSLSKNAVETMLVEIQESVNEQNADKFALHFTEDAEITLIMPSNMGGTIVMNMTQYLTILKEGWDMPLTATYEVKNIDITIAPDKNSAVVTDITVETISMDGKLIMSSETEEVIKIVQRAGAPKVNSIHGKVKLVMHNNAPQSGI